MRKEHEAAVKIQSAFRTARAQKEFRLLKTAASVIQQHLRARRNGAEAADRVHGTAPGRQ